VDWTVNSAADILVVPSYARAEYAIDLVTKWQNISRSFLADGGIMHQPAPPVKNWRILLVKSFTARTPLLTATSAFGLGRKRWISPQQCYLLCRRTFPDK